MGERALDLDELERLAREATPGPWSALSTGVRGGDHWYVTDAGEAVALVSANDSNPDDPRRENAQFIAATDPETVLALVARVREAEARIEKVVRLRDRMEQQRDDIDESVRLSTMIRDLNAVLTEGDER